MKLTNGIAREGTSGLRSLSFPSNQLDTQVRLTLGRALVGGEGCIRPGAHLPAPVGVVQEASGLGGQRGRLCDHNPGLGRVLDIPACHNS
jgi:hypothetical protein